MPKIKIILIKKHKKDEVTCYEAQAFVDNKLLMSIFGCTSKAATLGNMILSFSKEVIEEGFILEEKEEWK